MTREELLVEIEELKKKARKVGGREQYNEYEVLYRKMAMAESYLMSVTDIAVEEMYGVKNTNDTFYVTRLNGIFAWGYQNNQKVESGVPIALLERV